jgi:tetratricopeptide (TPR) repeat protein
MWPGASLKEDGMKTDRWGRHSLVAGLTITLSLAALLAALAVPAGAQTETAPAADPLTQATQLYDQSRFDDAVNLLKQALMQGAVTGGDAVKAKELLARAYVKAGNRVEAREVFKGILRQDPEYRADALRMPPDEIEVFNLALKDFQAEQVEAGKRIPASIALHGGTGFSSNKPWSDVVKNGGGKEFNGGGEFGGSVRFPLRPRWSLDVEYSLLKDTSSDTARAPNQIKFEVSALPLVVSGYYNLLGSPRYRMNVFLGAGPLLKPEAKISLNFFGTLPISIAAEKTGLYIHGGVEGEYLLHPRLAITGRALGRYAKSGKLDFKNKDLYLYSDANLKLQGRQVDFSGFALQAGLRAYIGY